MRINMMIILERDELEWIEEIRRGFCGMRALYGLYKRGKMEKDRLIASVEKDLSEIDVAMNRLKERGI